MEKKKLVLFIKVRRSQISNLKRILKITGNRQLLRKGGGKVEGGEMENFIGKKDKSGTPVV